MNLFSYIKQQLPILEVINEYTPLKKAGLYWKGCCPFHHERTPSFTVSPHKDIFYCFGCHAGGDVISFIAKTEHCSPIDAARHIIERYRIQVPQGIAFEKSENQETKNAYYTVCSVFAQWCHQELKKHPSILGYLEQRGLRKESIDSFMLGYCSRTVKSLLTFAQERGILAQNFINAHILVEGKVGLYSKFEDRILFPIKDHLGRCVGFGGRVHKPDDVRAKYYNSQDHALFNKGSLLYGLDRAKKSIAQQETAFLVEGYTDLIIMNQYGFTNTVATLGTACTLEHLKQLSRYARRIYLMYDGDTAGQKALLRLVELCWQVTLEPLVIVLPPEEDPASFLLKGGNLQDKAATAGNIFSFMITHLSADFKAQHLQEKMHTSQKVLSMISHISDPLKRDLLLQQAQEAFQVPLTTLKQQMLKQKVLPTTSTDPKEVSLDISLVEKKLFSAILVSKEHLEAEDAELVMLLASEAGVQLFDTIRKALTATGVNTHILFETASLEEKELLSGLLIGDPDESGLSLTSLLGHFFRKQWKKKIQDVKLRLYTAQQEGNKAHVQELIAHIDTVKKKMLQREISWQKKEKQPN